MAGNYYYFVSSLPHLKLGDEPMFGSEEFIQNCALQLSESDYRQLLEISLLPSDTSHSFVQSKWNSFETSLRNTAVHIRALKLKCEPGQYLRQEQDLFGGLETHVQDAFSHNPLGMEEHLDSVRWQFLESLLVGREFSFDTLAVYKIKLLLLEKRVGSDRKQGEEILETFLNEKLTSDQLPEFING